MGAADYRLSEYLLQVHTTSLATTPVAVYVAVPFDGEIVESRVTIYGAITSAASTNTLAVLPAGVAASAVDVGTTLDVAVSGSAAGKTYSAAHTGSRTVRAGDSIRITPAGATGASIRGDYVIKIRR